MEIRPNKLRYALKNKLPTLGTRIESTWPYIAEIAASSGVFDYVEFEGEYAPYTEPDFENICRAVELHGCATVNKIDRQNLGFMAQKSIACGAHGLLLADLYNADEVKEALNLLCPSSPGGGIMGRPNRRLGMNGMGRMTMERYLKQVNDTVMMIMIEKEDAMKNLEEICKVPGVDMVVFGPHDYSMNVGWEPFDSWDKLKVVHTKMIETAAKHGVHTCVQLNTIDDVQYYYDIGVRHFNVGDEMDLHIGFYRKECKGVRDLLSK